MIYSYIIVRYLVNLAPDTEHRDAVCSEIREAKRVYCADKGRHHRLVEQCTAYMVVRSISQ